MAPLFAGEGGRSLRLHQKVIQTTTDCWEKENYPHLGLRHLIGPETIQTNDKIGSQRSPHGITVVFLLGDSCQSRRLTNADVQYLLPSNPSSEALLVTKDQLHVNDDALVSQHWNTHTN